MYQNFKDTLKNIMSWYNGVVFRHTTALLILTCLTTAGSLYFALQLPVKTDFFELLPENYRSIDDLNKVIDHVGGVGNLIIAVETTDFEAGKKYVEDIASAIKQLPKDEVTDVNYNIKDIRKFFENNILLYLDKDDLIKVKERLNAKLEYEKKNNNPLYFFKELLTPVEFNVDDIRQKYEKRTGKDEESFKDGYISGYNNTLLAIMIKPRGSAAGIEKAKSLIQKVQKILDEHPAANYHPSIKPHLCGNFQSMVEEYDIIINDVVETLLLVFALVGLVIFIFLGTLSSIFLLLLNLSVSASWTMGITYLYIRQLNSQTAFLTSLVIGTGVNYGIIYLARYYEERKKNRSIQEAIVISSNSTIIQTFLASATTAVAFITLMFAHTRGFSQFGFIGAVGVTLCWINTFAILPVFIITWEKILSKSGVKIKFNVHFNAFKHLSPYIMKYYKTTLALFVLILCCTIYFTIQYYPHKLETDFSKLRNVQSENKGTAYWDEKVGKLFGDNASLTPAVVIAKDAAEAEKICDSIDGKIKDLPEKFKGIASCYSVTRMLPDKQEEKLPIVKEIRKLLYSKSVKFLDDKRYDDIVKFREKIKTRPLVPKDLPYSITKNFDDIYGNIGVIVVVNPLMEQKLTENLVTFAELVRKNELPDGKVVYSSGESVIYADLLNAIAVDGPKVTILSFLLVLLVVFISVRRIKDTVIIIFTLLSGVTFMAGLISFCDIKLNFFNFIALPLTFGICVDYGANMFLRYKQDG
ncbi:MAG: MMPL family transporter, partial [Pseudomonadota bacterium]